MGDLLHQLHVDLRGIIIQAIGFLAMMIILWKFAFNRVIMLIETRRQNMADQIRAIEERQKLIDQKRKELEEKLENINREARERLDKAIEEANIQRERILERARQEAEAETVRIRAEIEREKRRAISDLRETVSEMALSIAEKIVEANLDQAKHEALIDQMIEQITPSLLEGISGR